MQLLYYNCSIDIADLPVFLGDEIIRYGKMGEVINILKYIVLPLTNQNETSSKTQNKKELL